MGIGQVSYYLEKAKEEVLKPAKFIKNIAIGTIVFSLICLIPPLIIFGIFVTAIFLPIGIVLYAVYYRSELKRARQVVEAIDRGDYLVALRMLESLTAGGVRLGVAGAHYASALGYLQQAVLLMSKEAESS